MLSQYLKIAIRNIGKNKLFTFINILSLSSGIMFCLLIYLFAYQELNHDDFHVNKGNIYRVSYRHSDPFDGGIDYTSLHQHEMAESFKKDVSGVKDVTTLKKTYRTWVEYEDKSFENDLAFVDSTFFTLFTFPALAGNPEDMLAGLTEVVITKEVADRYFGIPGGGYDEYLGKTLTFPKGDQKEFIIAGIVEIPNNSSISFDMAIRHKHHGPYPESNTFTGNASLFVLLEDNVNPKVVEKAAGSLIDKHLGEMLDQMTAYYFDEGDELVFEFYLQPLNEMYLNEEIRTDYEASSSNEFIKIMIIVAILVLIISCINYVMLTTGQSFQRLKEIGMRKVLGAKSMNINFQFWGEALLISLISLIIGIVMAQLILPVFNYLSNRQIEFDLLQPSLIIFVLGLILFITFIVGFLPGLTINRINTSNIFRKQTKYSGGSRFSSIFVVVQYSFSILFVIVTLVVINQMEYIKGKDTGLIEENVVVVNLPDDFSTKQINRFVTDLKSKTTISSVSGSDRNFIFGSSTMSLKKSEDESIYCRFIRADPDYVETLGLEIIKGRNLSEERISDSTNAVLVNETLIRQLGWEDPIGKKLPTEFEDAEQPLVVGVVRDFHFDSMRDKIQPLFLHMNSNWNSIWHLFVKIEDADVTSGITAINESWNSLETGRPLSYTFLDDSLDQQYESEQKFALITGYSSIFTIIISSLGLFGLTLLVVTRRTKEVGIRKVNGATISNILVLFGRDFMKWVVIALIIASPLGYYAMERWLESYAFRVNIDWWVFAIAGVVAIVTAFLTVLFQIIKAASANPIDALRNE